MNIEQMAESLCDKCPQMPHCRQTLRFKCLASNLDEERDTLRASRDKLAGLLRDVVDAEGDIHPSWRSELRNRIDVALAEVGCDVVVGCEPSNGENAHV